MALTRQDRESFLRYCQQCTDTQLRNVYAKERQACRTAYANIAKQVMNERGIQ